MIAGLIHYALSTGRACGMKDKPLSFSCHDADREREVGEVGLDIAKGAESQRSTPKKEWKVMYEEATDPRKR